MTNSEKYDVVEEVCTEIRESLQREAERLREQAEKWKAKNELGWAIRCSEEANDMVKAQINVSAVQSNIQWRIIHKMVDEMDK